MHRPLILLGVVATLVLAAPASSAVQRTARVPIGYWNCTQLHKKYPHGVGKVNARDKTSGEPVTTFKRSNALYARAMAANRGLDRDKDGIACEKK